MVDKLKGKKATGIDTIIPELLKNSDKPTLNVIVKILNKIFDSGEFSEEWVVGIIVILFKAGEKNDLNNYRGITLLSVIGKLLVWILNERLIKFVEKHKIVMKIRQNFVKVVAQLIIYLRSTLLSTILLMLKRNPFMSVLLILKRHLIKYRMHCFGKN